MRRFAAASAILAAFLMSAGALAASTVPGSARTPAVFGSPAATDTERATAALEYLLAAQSSDGSIDGSLGETADFVIGAAAAGFDPATLHGCAGTTGALDFLASASDAAAADPAKTGKAILAVVAAGADPSSFAGRDLVARLNALYLPASGKFGDGSTFGQSFAILALHASGSAVPAAASAELAALQDPDGSWSYGSAPVAAGNGDTNSTAVALMALDEAGVHSADSTGLAYLATQQLADGGFPYQNSSAFGPPASDPDSDAIVLEALLRAGQDPESATWSKGSATVLSHLRSMQGADGGFVYPGMGESAFTTSQVPAALMRSPYGATVHFTAGRAVPTTLCAPAATPTPTSTATPSPSPTAIPTASPTPTPIVTPTASPTRAPTARPTLRTTPRPTVRPAAEATVLATPVATPTPTPSPALTPRPTPTAASTATPALDPGAVVAGASGNGPGSTAGSGSSDSGSGIPAPLIYALGLAIGLALVLGVGWFLMFSPRSRP